MLRALLTAISLAVPAAGTAPAQPVVGPVEAPSRALGYPFDGRLRDGVVLPESGPDHVTWDDTEGRSPNPDWRRVGTQQLVDEVLRVLHDVRQAHPGEQRLVVQDLSLPEGGPFGAEYGGLGHASHQNGLDADIAYPRKDGRERGISAWKQADPQLSQALVTAFVKAGAQKVFVGPSTHLKGPKDVVQVVPAHDDHLHVRIPNPNPKDVRALRR